MCRFFFLFVRCLTVWEENRRIRWRNWWPFRATSRWTGWASQPPTWSRWLTTCPSSSTRRPLWNSTRSSRGRWRSTSKVTTTAHNWVISSRSPLSSDLNAFSCGRFNEIFFGDKKKGPSGCWTCVTSASDWKRWFTCRRPTPIATRRRLPNGSTRPTSIHVIWSTSPDGWTTTSFRASLHSQYLSTCFSSTLSAAVCSTFRRIRYQLGALHRGDGGRHLNVIPEWMRLHPAEISVVKVGRARRNARWFLPPLAAKQRTTKLWNDHQSTAGMLSECLMCTSSPPDDKQGSYPFLKSA